MTFAPAVLASDASSPSGSRGSAVDPGRITPTSTARSWRTDNSVRFSSANSLVSSAPWFEVQNLPQLYEIHGRRLIGRPNWLRSRSSLEHGTIRQYLAHS